MYSWRTIRTVCTVLLFLPVIHVVYLISQHTMAALNPSPKAWESEVEAYISADTATSLPASPIVVVGGAGVKLWNDLPRDLAPAPVLMRGLGDAIVEDIAFYYSRLIGYYQPSAVVLLTSSMEFFIRDNKSAQELVAAIEALLNEDAYHDATRPFYVYAPLKTPLRPQDHATINVAFRELQTLAAKTPKLILLDANRALSDGKDRPQPRYFRADGIHLNEHGYLRLTALLAAQLNVNNASNEEVSVSL